VFVFRLRSTLRMYQTTSIILVLILVVIGVIVCIFVMRIILNRSPNKELANSSSIIASLVNAVQIQVLNALYFYAAVMLNDYENHRTDTQYEDALISKTFAFQFVNSFASLFYIAFVKDYIIPLDSCRPSCMVELQTGLGTIFLTRLLTGSLLQVSVPYINKRLRESGETKGLKSSSLTPVEEQFIQVSHLAI
jgi:hypothetical protein